MPDLVKYTIRIDGFDVHYNLYRKLDLNPEITLNQFGELIAVLFNRKPDQKFIITNYRDEVLFVQAAPIALSTRKLQLSTTFPYSKTMNSVRSSTSSSLIPIRKDGALMPSSKKSK